MGVTILEYMADCRDLVLDEMAAMIPRRGPLAPVLYDLIFDYPLRDAKALRPALCMATCRAQGGSLEAVTRSATVLELFHNAFLIHDDIEDGSQMRRTQPTLHRTHGTPIAINVGDAMFGLTLEPLLENTRTLDLGRALKILRVVARMVRESAEGQALELAWVQHGDWTLRDGDYLRMVHKKTTYYTFITPLVVGAIVAGASSEVVVQLRLFATALGSAFQIQDDVLNVVGDERQVGKEADGDLWEGKHTLILLHAVRTCTEIERRKANEVLRKRRPPDAATADTILRLRDLVTRLEAEGRVTSAEARLLREGVVGFDVPGSFKTVEDVQFLRELARRQKSIDYARSVAAKRAKRARRSLEAISSRWPPSVHKDFLHGVTDFVVTRDH